MPTHLSLLEVFQEMTRLREENMRLSDEVARLQKKEREGFPAPALMEVRVEVQAHELATLTRDEVQQAAINALASHVAWRTFLKQSRGEASEFDGRRAWVSRIWVLAS